MGQVCGTMSGKRDPEVEAMRARLADLEAEKARAQAAAEATQRNRLEHERLLRERSEREAEWKSRQKEREREAKCFEETEKRDRDRREREEAERRRKAEAGAARRAAEVNNLGRSASSVAEQTRLDALRARLAVAEGKTAEIEAEKLRKQRNKEEQAALEKQIKEAEETLAAEERRKEEASRRFVVIHGLKSAKGTALNNRLAEFVREETDGSYRDLLKLRRTKSGESAFVRVKACNYSYPKEMRGLKERLFENNGFTVEQAQAHLIAMEDRRFEEDERSAARASAAALAAETENLRNATRPVAEPDCEPEFEGVDAVTTSPRGTSTHRPTPNLRPFSGNGHKLSDEAEEAGSMVVEAHDQQNAANIGAGTTEEDIVEESNETDQESDY